MSVIDEIAKINKDIRSFELKMRKPGVVNTTKVSYMRLIKELKAKRDELCKKL